MRRSAARILLAAPLLSSAAVYAQADSLRTADVTTEQIGQADARRVPPASPPAASRDPANQLPAQISDGKQAVRPLEQLQPRITSHAGTPQLAREGKQAGGSPQLGRKERSARGAQPISAPSDGRQTGSVKIGGRDRCDPQAPNAGSAACKSVIETRSAEFRAPASPIPSPEQRLLIDQERAEMRTVRGAVQRVGRNDVDADAIETQALAAIAGTRPAEDPQPQSVDPVSPAGLEAMIQIIGAAQGAQNPN